MPPHVVVAGVRIGQLLFSLKLDMDIPNIGIMLDMDIPNIGIIV